VEVEEFLMITPFFFLLGMIKKAGNSDEKGERKIIAGTKSLTNKEEERAHVEEKVSVGA
jgi:hypothetical protein